ncbi:hypothetical protein [Scytonema sp. NUACC26]
MNGFAVVAVELDTEHETLMVENTTVEDAIQANKGQEVLKP